MNLRWPKRFATLLHLHANHTQPAEVPSREAEVPSNEGVRLKREYLCADCRAKRKNSHQVRAGRARARNAPRDERGRYLGHTSRILPG
jgi:hypothetical protein